MQHAQITTEYFKGEKHYVRTQMKENKAQKCLFLHTYLSELNSRISQLLNLYWLLVSLYLMKTQAVIGQLEQGSPPSAVRVDVKSWLRASALVSNGSMSASWLYYFLMCDLV